MASSNQDPSDKPTKLPPGKVKFLMKSAPNPGAISGETVMITTQSAEWFLEKILTEAYEKNKKQGEASRKISYQDIAAIISENECYEFLSDIAPLKVTVGEARDVPPTSKDNTSEIDDSSQ